MTEKEYLNFLETHLGKIEWEDDIASFPIGNDVIVLTRREDKTLRVFLEHEYSYFYDFGPFEAEVVDDSFRIEEESDLIEKTLAIINATEFPKGVLVSFEIEQSVYDALTKNDSRSFDEIVTEALKEFIERS